MNNSTIAFIGAGNMASSIIGGLIKNGWPKDQLLASAPTEARLSSVRANFGIRAMTDNHQAARQADIIILCVKPQMMKAVLTDLQPSLKLSTLLISVAAGITMNSLQSWMEPQPGQEPQFNNKFAIVRSMPNTPSLLQFGACGLFANHQVSPAQKAQTERIFNAIGIASWVNKESLLDAVIAVSGSGPAYYFLFMEVMEKVGTELGLDTKTAQQLTAQTALGAAKMALESGTNTQDLRQRVTSPGGTTEQAIKAFQEGGLAELIEKAMHAAVRRSIELAEALKD